MSSTEREYFKVVRPADHDRFLSIIGWPRMQLYYQPNCWAMAHTGWIFAFESLEWARQYLPGAILGQIWSCQVGQVFPSPTFLLDSTWLEIEDEYKDWWDDGAPVDPALALMASPAGTICTDRLMLVQRIW